ncbi:MAG: hypothetical protein ACREFU_05355 [Acetobacteraceae bacterium]
MMDMSIAATGFALDPSLREPADSGEMTSYYQLSFGGSSIAADGWERVALIDLVHRFARQGLAWAEGDRGRISATTEGTAERFLTAIPMRKALPRISPDGEGGLMMVWESPADRLLVTIDECLLQVVVAAATPRATYLNDLSFDGAEIPRNVLAAIPDR